MNKKVMVISSTPRSGGNSDVLCDRFVEGAQNAGNTAEKIRLADLTIKYCTGCGACNRTHRCVQKDDMDGVLKAMVAADVIVLATPVYFYTMCAQLKTLIDRTVARYTEITNKEFYFILAAADGRKEALVRTVEEFRGFLDCLDGSKERGIVYGTGAWGVGEILNSEAMSDAYALGQNV